MKDGAEENPYQSPADTAEAGPPSAEVSSIMMTMIFGAVIGGIFLFAALFVLVFVVGVVLMFSAS